MLQKATNQDFWHKLMESLKTRFGNEIYGMWFEELTCLEGPEEDQLVIGVPNDFSQVWIHDNYLEYIQKEVSSHAPQAMKVVLRVVPSQPGAAVEESTSTTPEPRVQISTSRRRLRGSRPRSYTEPLGLNPRNTFSNFVVGPNNQLAHAACIAVANAPGSAYNPLFLYGDTGLGKTHLMHAVAHCIADKDPDSQIRYVSCESFTNEYIKAISEHRTHKFRELYRNVDVLLIDDVHFLSNKEGIQQEFFHTFNELFENQKQIILTSDRPVTEIAQLESRLVSRFQMGMVADLQPPDLETRMAILNKKAKALQYKLNEEILHFLARRITRNVRRLEGSLIRVGSYAELARREVTLEGVQDILKDLLQEEARDQVTIDKIQQQVADFYNLRASDLTGPRRPNLIALPRQVAMYLCRKQTKHSLKEIGEAFGGRHHGTVMHACKTVEDMMSQDAHYRQEIEWLVTQVTKNSQAT